MSDLINLIEVLQRRQLIWHGRDHQPPPEVVSSGYQTFDEKLSGGFPKTGVVSIDSPVGIGELRFLTTMLSGSTLPSLSDKSRLLVFINPPGILYAEFFYHQNFDLNNILVIYPRQKNEALWTAEQCLKSGACGAVLLWQNMLEMHQVKRLQIATEEGHCLQFLMRSSAQRASSLPVSLGLKLSANEQGLEVSVNKRKGGWEIPRFTLDMSSHWPLFSLHSSLSKPTNIVPFPKTQRHQGR